ncbi:MAG: hypothetical protein ABW128_06295 [Rhizorhabdus sp.]
MPMAAAWVCSSVVAAAAPRIEAHKPQLAAGADDAAIMAVRQTTRGMTSATVDRSQSFRIVDRGRHVATLVAGKGQAHDGMTMKCFMALVQDGRTTLVPTIGSGNWEAETCGRALATGLIVSGDIVLIGIVYEAASPNTLVREPVVLRWNRRTRTLVPDEALSQRASEKGATTIAAMRRLLP